MLAYRSLIVTRISVILSPPVMFRSMGQADTAQTRSISALKVMLSPALETTGRWTRAPLESIEAFSNILRGSGIPFRSILQGTST